MFAAILMAAFLATHAVKEQEKIDYKKEKNRPCRLVCSEIVGVIPKNANDCPFAICAQYMRCENNEVICYLVYGNREKSISCIPNPKNQKNIK